MTISSDDVAKLDALLGGADAERSAVMALRQALPHLSLTSCDPSDIDAEAPFRDYPRFSVYLVDGSQHCWTLTADVAKATGLVVVQHKVARG